MAALIHLGLLFFGGVSLTLPATTEARGTELALGDVCRVAGADPEEVARVAALSLGYTPAPGYTRLLEAWRLRQIVERAAPGIQVELVGAPACRVSPATERVAGAAVEAAARAELERRLASLDAAAQLLTPVADLSVPAGAAAPELESVLDPTQSLAGNVSVPVRVLVDGDVYRTIWTRWSVELWAEHAVLVADVAAGTAISADMLETRRLQVSAAALRPGARLLGQALLVGAVAARDLQAGRPLTDLDVQRPTLVNAGDTLFLEVVKGPINARIAAVAEQPGALGDRIEVTLPGSGRRMKATVVSRDAVRIDLSTPR
jgi:flagella basal body P-ring formation protein FlgA